VRLRSFFRYLVGRRKSTHITYNVAADLNPIKVNAPRKLALTRAEFAASVSAVKKLPSSGP